MTNTAQLNNTTTFVLIDTRTGKVRRGRPTHSYAAAAAHLLTMRTDSMGRYNPAKNRSISIAARIKNPDLGQLFVF